MSLRMINSSENIFQINLKNIQNKDEEFIAFDKSVINENEFKLYNLKTINLIPSLNYFFFRHNRTSDEMSQTNNQSKSISDIKIFEINPFQQQKQIESNQINKKNDLLSQKKDREKNLKRTLSEPILAKDRSNNLIDEIDKKYFKNNNKKAKKIKSTNSNYCLYRINLTLIQFLKHLIPTSLCFSNEHINKKTSVENESYVSKTRSQSVDCLDKKTASLQTISSRLSKKLKIIREKNETDNNNNSNNLDVQNKNFSYLTAYKLSNGKQIVKPIKDLNEIETVSTGTSMINKSLTSSRFSVNSDEINDQNENDTLSSRSSRSNETLKKYKSISSGGRYSNNLSLKQSLANMNRTKRQNIIEELSSVLDNDVDDDDDGDEEILKSNKKQKKKKQNFKFNKKKKLNKKIDINSIDIETIDLRDFAEKKDEINDKILRKFLKSGSASRRRYAICSRIDKLYYKKQLLNYMEYLLREDYIKNFLL